MATPLPIVPSAFPWRQPGIPRREAPRTLVTGVPQEPAASLIEPVPPKSPLHGVQWSFLYAAFLLYIFVITTYQLPIATVAMLIALVGLVFQRDDFRLPSLLVWLGSYVLWSASAYVSTRYPDIVWEFLIAYLKLWAVTLVAVNALRSRAHVRLFMVLFLGCFALFPLRGALANYYIYHEAKFGRAYWNFIYNNPNDLAAIALLQLSLAAGLLVTEGKGWVKTCAMVGGGLLPLLILMTQSRAGFIALCVFTVCALFGPRPQRTVAAARRASRKHLVAFILVALAVSAAAPSGVWDRVRGLKGVSDTDRLSEVDPEGSAKARFEVWKVAKRIIRDHPVSGVGLGAYNLAHESYAERLGFPSEVWGKKDAHSTYLHVTAETGIPGLLLFVGMILSAVIRAERIRRVSRRVLPSRSAQLFYVEAGLLAFCVAGIFGSFSHLSFLYIQLALLLVLAEACRRDVNALRGTRRPSKRRV
jgi:O-antigen ligase